jgi:large subunit ribosomal protein L15
MKLNTLQPKEGSTKARTRVGRGIGSGKGKTSGVGQKGQKSRKGVAIKGFEGGQMPLERRLPKFGFNNKKFATQLVEVSLGKLQDAIDAKKLDAKKTIDEAALVAAGLIRRVKDGVKLLGSGELKTKVDLKITKASASAQAAVEKAGGKIDFIVRDVKPVVRKDGKGVPKDKK